MIILETFLVWTVVLMTGVCMYFFCEPFVRWLWLDHQVLALVNDKNRIQDWYLCPQKVPKALSAYLIIGGNNINIYKDITIQMINEAKHKLTIVSCSALSTHWDEAVASHLEASAKRGVAITFVVGEESFLKAEAENKNLPIQDLIRRRMIQLRVLKISPRADFRLVDDDRAFFTWHGNGQPNGERLYVLLEDKHPVITYLIEHIRSEVETLVAQSTPLCEEEAKAA